MPQPPILLFTAEQIIPPQRGLQVYTVPPFGRRVGEQRHDRSFACFLRPPTVLFVASPIRAYSAAGRTRMDRVRRSPHWALSEPTAVFTAPFAPLDVTLAASRFGLRRRLLQAQGVSPPVVTASVTAPFVASPIRVDLAPQSRSWRRSAQWRIGGPVLILPLPTLQMQTITVRCVAVRTRVERPQHEARSTRIFAPVVLAQPSAFVAAPLDVALVAVAQRAANQRRRPFYDLFSPTVLAQPPPTLDQQTVKTTLVSGRGRAERIRREPYSRLGGPTVLQTFAGPPPTLALRARNDLRRREPSSRLSPPVFYPATSEITVSLSVQRPRGESRRAPHSKLSPPAVAAVTVADKIAVVLAGRARVESARRAPRSRLSPPVFYPSTSVIAVTLAGRTRADDSQRRRTRSFLSPPTVVRVPSVEQAEQTIRVVLAGRTRVDAQRRHARPFLSPPVVLQTFRGPVVALTKVRPRPTSTFLTPPTVVRVPSVEQQEQTIRVTLAQRPRVELARRAPRSRLSPPVFYPATSVIEVLNTAVQNRLSRLRRGTRSFLQPPVAPVTAAPTQVQQTVKVLDSGRERLELARRAPHSKLSPPTVVLPLPTLREQTIKVFTAWKARLDDLRRGPRSKLIPPTILAAPSSFVAPPVEVKTALRPRIEVSRRAPHSLLRPPVVVIPTPTLREQTVKVTLVRVDMRRRGSKARLAPPAVILPPPTLREQTVRVALAWRARVELLRRPARYRLAPPRVVISQPTPAQQTIQVALAAIRVRDAMRRRFPLQTKEGTDRVLGPHVPRVVIPPPTQAMQTVVVTLVAVKTRLSLVERPARARLGVPTALQTFSGPAVNLARRARFELGRRGPRYELSKPVDTPPQVTKILGSLTAIRSRLALLLRKPFSRLFKPTGLPTPTLHEQTIKVTCVAVSTRAGLGRHAPHSTLHAPVVVGSPLPTVEQQTIRIHLVAVAVRAALLRRLPHPKLHPPVPAPREQILRLPLTATIESFAAEAILELPSDSTVTLLTDAEVELETEATVLNLEGDIEL